MNPNDTRLNRVKEKLLNKSFYSFVFSFIAVVAGALLFIFLVGLGSRVQ